jgi:hypothetical protein
MLLARGGFIERSAGVNLRRSIKTGARLLWILMLVPGLLRVPLPQADFHNIRHHHELGQICPHHDHLLRWHPTASQNDDVAVVHWHWIIPRLGDQGEGSAAGDDDSPGVPRPVLHAYHLDCLEPDWTAHPVISPDVRGRFAPGALPMLAALRPASEAYLTGAILYPARLEWGFIPPAGKSLRALLLGLGQRWNC